MLQESDDSVRLPLGFFGGIEDSLSGVVLIREGGRRWRPYDSHLGQWMAPDEAPILEGKIFFFSSIFLKKIFFALEHRVVCRTIVLSLHKAK